MEQDYVSYVVILDPQRNVIMHSDLAQVGETFDDALTMAAVHSNEPGCTHRGPPPLA